MLVVLMVKLSQVRAKWREGKVVLLVLMQLGSEMEHERWEAVWVGVLLLKPLAEQLVVATTSQVLVLARGGSFGGDDGSKEDSSFRGVGVRETEGARAQAGPVRVEPFAFVGREGPVF